MSGVAVEAASSRDPPLALQHRCVAVTGAEEGASALSDLLCARGARVIELPLIRILPPDDAAALQEAAAQLSRYDWLVFTSANAARALRAALPRGSGPAARPRWIAAVGSATARAVDEEFGWSVDAVPTAFSADHITAAMQAVTPLFGRSVLWPRAAGARTVLREQLETAGAKLHAPEAYRTEPVREAAAELARRLAANEVDAVTFTSPSAVRCFADTGARTGAACIAVIGPTTAAAAEAAGLPVHVQPAEHTLPALVEALILYLAGPAEKRPRQSGKEMDTHE